MSTTSSLIEKGKPIGGLAFIAGGLVAGSVLQVWVTALFLNAKPEAVTPGFLFFLGGLHAGSCLLLSAVLYLWAARLRLLSPRNWFLTGLVMSAAFPAVGFFAMLAVFLVFIASPSEKTSAYDEYSRYITHDFKPEEKYMASDKLVEGISRELEVTPLVEVLGEDDSSARRGAVNVIEKLPKKDAVRLLKTALGDKSVEVRYLAASELSRVEAEFNENVFMARKEVERDSQSYAAHLALANGYAEYYESGLLDDYAAKYYLALSIAEYKKTLSLGGENIQVLNYLGNLELGLKHYDEALSKFKRVLQLDPENVYAHVGLIHIFYDKGRIREVIQYAKEAMKKMPETRGPMREIVQFWAST
ncbi:MAG: tetratricopeptide repeat protein [Candidatus Omnitrophota bacterium]